MQATDLKHNCGDCKFVMRVGMAGGAGREWFECRRHSPSVRIDDDAQAGVWPIVIEFQWCGNHESNLVETEPEEENEN